jgi:hypothetical protein
MLDISNAQRRSLLQRLAAPPKPFRPKRTFYRTQSAIGPPDVFVTLRPPAGPADAESPAFSSPDIGTQTATSTPFAAGDASLQQPLLSPLADSNAAAGGSMIERPRNLLSAVSIRDSRLASGRAPLTAFHAAILMQQQAAARAANGQARPGATPPAQQQKGFTVPTTEHGNAASSTAAMPEGGAEKRPGGTSPSGGSPQPSLLSQALRVSDSGGGPTPASTTAAAAAAVAAPAAAAGVAASAPAGWAGCNILWPSPGAADGSHQGSPGPWAAGDEEQPQQQQLLFPATEQGVAAEVSVVLLQGSATKPRVCCIVCWQPLLSLWHTTKAVHKLSCAWLTPASGSSVHKRPVGGRFILPWLKSLERHCMLSMHLAPADASPFDAHIC